jgi:hypothetical protein
VLTHITNTASLNQDLCCALIKTKEGSNLSSPALLMTTNERLVNHQNSNLGGNNNIKPHHIYKARLFTKRLSHKNEKVRGGAKGVTDLVLFGKQEERSRTFNNFTR